MSNTHTYNVKEKDSVQYPYCTDMGKYIAHKTYNKTRTGFDETKTFYTDLSGNIVVAAGADVSVIGTQVPCPSTEVERLEVCANVNGMGCYHIYKLVTPSCDTDTPSTLIRYEWFDNEIIDIDTVTVQEICCTCDCECGKALLPVLLADTRCDWTGGSFTLGGSSLIGRLMNPGQYDDPLVDCLAAGYTPAECAGFDFSCTDYFPIGINILQAVYSPDGGATWIPMTLPSSPVQTLTSFGDIVFRDDGYGLGLANLPDIFNTIPEFVINGGTAYPAAGNAIVFDHPSGVEFRFLYQFEYAIPPSTCNLDPYHREWTDEGYVIGTDAEEPFIPPSLLGTFDLTAVPSQVPSGGCNAIP